MADELRMVLTIIGVLLIGGIFGHGLWSIRKNKEQLREYKQPNRNEPSFDGKASAKKGLDEQGVGQPRKRSNQNAEQRSEPVIDSSTVELEQPQDVFVDDGQIEPSIGQTSSPAASEDSETPAESDPQAAEPSEVLIIHVNMPDNQTISGASLLPMLISMGFKFGEMDIFHRHEDSAGNGAVLFSLASMYNPGTFDIDNIEQISTKGLSLFMTLPCRGEALQNFNMMHNAAKKVAEEFGGQILDSQRSAMTVQTVRHYVEKIREFERQQLIRG